MKYLFVTVLLFITTVNAEAFSAIRGLRIDPSYFYYLYPDLTPKQIAQKVIDRVQEAHVNTIFLYAYNPSNGAFYPTNYPLLEIEPAFGTKNIFGEIYSRAKAEGLQVIASISSNDFSTVWNAKPEWRSKLKDGTDYKPMPQVSLLSAWHPEYRAWFQGFVADLAKRFPGLLAIEAIEPTVDCYWNGEPDFNPEAVKAFYKLYPKGTPGDSNWKIARAKGLTDLLGLMAKTAHSLNLKAGVVQTWPALANGELYTFSHVRDFVGFDLNEILNLSGAQKVDFVVGELLWQQWRAEYGMKVFTPQWTKKAAIHFLKMVGTRSTGIIHVEISPWHGHHSSIEPTLNEFQESLQTLRSVAPHIDVYDFSQLENREAWKELSVWK